MENRDRIWLLADLNYHEALREQARRSGGEVVEGEGATFTAGPHPHPVANTAFRTERSADPRRFVERAIDFYRKRRHGFGVLLHDSVEDAEVVEIAQAGGVLPVVTPPEMILEKRLEERAPAAGVEIRRVRDEATLHDFADVAAQAWATYGVPFDVPKVLFSRLESLRAPHLAGVVAYVDGAPASVALVLLSHGIAGIYWVSTVPGARGKGLGEACTRAVTNLGFDLGARWVSLQASPMGEPIYRRMGFVEVGRYQLLLSSPPEA